MLLTVWEDFETAAERLYLQDPMKVKQNLSLVFAEVNVDPFWSCFSNVQPVFDSKFYLKMLELLSLSFLNILRNKLDNTYNTLKSTLNDGYDIWEFKT